MVLIAALDYTTLRSAAAVFAVYDCVYFMLTLRENVGVRHAEDVIACSHCFRVWLLLLRYLCFSR